MIKKTTMLFIVFCGITLGNHVLADVNSKTLEKQHLKLYANFDDGVKPVIAQDGCGLKKAKNNNFVSGKFGNAVNFPEKSKKISDLIYKAGKALANNNWTIALWVKLEKNGNAYSRGKGHSRTIFRTFTTGGWGDGDIFSAFSIWGRLGFDNFAANRKQFITWIGGKALTAQEWTHLTFTCKDGLKRIFINSYEARYLKNKTFKTPGMVQKYLRLGNMYPKSKGQLRGALDELKVFNKALEEEEIKAIMNTQPNAGGKKIKPVFYAPLEGKVDAISDRKKNLPGNISRVNFAKAVIGQGAILMRLGYDARSIMSFNNIQKITSQAMTADFFFIPRTGADKETRGLLAAQSKNCSWIFFRSGKELIFKLTSNKCTSSVKIAVNWEKGIPVHILGGYDLKNKQIFLALNGKKINSTPITFAVKTNDSANIIVGDIPGTDRYQKSLAEGIIDEVRIFDSILTPKQAKAEFTRKDHSAQILAKHLSSRPIEILASNAKEKQLWDISGAWKAGTASRKKISLNALWRFQLTTDDKFPGNSNWHYLAIPGRYTGHGNGRSDHQFLIRDKNFNLLSTRQIWDGEPAYRYRNAWFERTFKASPEWKSKKVILRFDELSNSGRGILYLNGKKLAKLSNKKNYNINIPTDQLNYKTENHLLLYVYDNGNRWSWRGVKGDTWLLIAPKVTINSPYIVTSFRNNEITIQAEVKNSSTRAVSLALNASIKGKNGFALHSQNATIAAGKSKILTLKRSWKNPRLWDTVDPYLYTCDMSLTDKSGKLIDEFEKIKFGFREFWINDSDYVLNGKKIHLLNFDDWLVGTSDYEWCKKYVRLLKSVGFNSLRGPFQDKDSYMPNILRACNEEGMLYFMNALGVKKNEFVSWNNPATRHNLEKEMVSLIKANRNNPSIVLWYLSVNFLGYGWDYHPLKMADGYLPEYQQDKLKACNDAVKILHKYDKSRPYFMQAGGAFGPIINSNAYFCWWPEAERIAWPQEWSKRKANNKPLHIIETSFPYSKSLFGMDLYLPGAKPLLLAESAARYMGPKAYNKIDERCLKLMRDPAGRSSSSVQWEFLAVHRYIPLLQELKDKMLVETIQHWRGADISGICPFAQLPYAFKRKSPHKSVHAAYSKRRAIKEFRTPGWHNDIVKVAAHGDIDPEKPLPYLQSLKRALSPLLVYIGGNKARPTSLDHAWFAGDKIEKSIVVVNDFRKSQELKLAWKLSANNTIYAKGQVNLIVKAGEVKHIPLNITAPDVQQEVNCSLSVESERLKLKPFAIKIYPKLKAVTINAKVALYDTKGITAGALNKLGVKTQNLSDLKSLKNIKLLIIGRESLNSKLANLARRLNLTEALRSGKLNIVVFEQKPEALKLLGLQALPLYARYVFKSETTNPILKNLTDHDLSYLRGAGTLVSEFQKPASSTQANVKSPLWHWSNTNMAASYPIRRPSSGKYQVLLSTGNDLVYTTLLEMNGSKGKILFCQMELSDRVGTDPNATTLFANIIRYYAQPIASEKIQELYADSDKALQFLTKLGFSPKKINRINEIPATSVILYDSQLNTASLKELQAFANKGGTVVFMPLNAESIKSLDLKQTTTTLNRYSITANGKNLLPALDARDRFFHYGQKLNILAGKILKPLTSPAFAAIQKQQNGQFIFVQLSPFGVDDKIKRDIKIGKGNSSNYWLDFITKERLLQFWSTLLGQLGCPAKSIASRFENMNKSVITQNIDGKWQFKTDPKNIGLKSGWNRKFLAAANSWRKLKPGYWEHQGITQSASGKKQRGDYNGCAWYRKVIKLAPALVGKKLRLQIKAVDDYDLTYVNGQLIGQTGAETQGYWAALRNYPIPARLIKDGKLTIAVKVLDIRGNGGIIGPIKIIVDRPASKFAAFPYYTDKMPKYNTESHHRW